MEKINTRSKKISILLSAILVPVILLSTLIPFQKALAATYTTDDGYTIDRTYNRGYTVKLTGYSGKDTELTLPAKGTFSGREYDVTEVDAFLGDAAKRTVTSVTIPEGYTTIDSSAFKGCSALVSVTIPSTVTSIGSNAFADCTSLKNVNIADGTKKLALNNASFTGCTSLENITLPSRLKADSDGTNAFYGCTKLQSVTVNNSDSYVNDENGALYAITDDGLILETYPESKISADFTVPSQVNGTAVIGLGAHAFRNNQKLEKLTVPESVTTFKRYSIDGCSNLKTLIINATDTTKFNYNNVDGYAFTNMAKGSVIYAANDEMKTTIENLKADQEKEQEDMYGSVIYEEDPRYTTENTTVEVMKPLDPKDLNEDGVVDLLDVTEAQKYYRASSSDENWESEKKADLNNDGVVDVQDLVEIYNTIYK